MSEPEQSTSDSQGLAAAPSEQSVKRTLKEAKDDETGLSDSETDRSAKKQKKGAEDEEEEQDEEEEAVTMVDVLQDEQNMEENAKALLGSADDSNCTYLKGYMKRQALYSCITCLPPESTDLSKMAALCLACSYHCHSNHEIVELYTKRHFRCDCGNQHLAHNPCKLFPEKDQENCGNRYNQNFKGLYCVCHRPYPDPEDSVPDEMIQCVLCEDWFHGRHLLGVESAPNSESFSEMICHLCFAQQHEWLAAYAELAVTQVEEGEAQEVDVVTPPERPCPLDKPVPSLSARALLMPSGWREQLCRCDRCRKLYEDKGLKFLLDPEDTVHHYEAQGSTSEASSQYERGCQVLSQMDRVKQVEAIRGYNDMKKNLLEYLKQFADQDKVVKPEHIQQFFEQMNAKKSRPIMPAKFCR